MEWEGSGISLTGVVEAADRVAAVQIREEVLWLESSRVRKSHNHGPRHFVPRSGVHPADRVAVDRHVKRVRTLGPGSHISKHRLERGLIHPALRKRGLGNAVQ